MRVLRCSVERFRGFDALDVRPQGHVLLVGEPRSGRSDLLAALGKVFEVDATRLDELDFHRGDLTQDIRVEVTLGDLDIGLQQRFLEQVEFWDPQNRSLIEGVDDPAAMPADAAPALRLAYRGRWDRVDERPVQTVYWSKSSDPSTDDLRRVSREDRAAIPFHRLIAGRPLNLAPRGLLRASLNTTEAEALGAALRNMTEGIGQLSAELAHTEPVVGALDSVITILRPYIGIDAPTEEIVRFLPDDGSLSALLRALAPALDLADGAGHLPLDRHGSTTVGQLASAEAIATAVRRHAVIVVDDFGDALDTASAQRLAGLLRRATGQVWLSTRRPEVARSFEATELLRLTRAPEGTTPCRRAHSVAVPVSRGARIAARELHRQILPAMTARSLIICEGPHDAAAYSALTERLETESGVLPPEAYGIRLMDAGSAEGGIDRVAQVAELTRGLGFRVIALVDYDRDEAQAASRLAALEMAADAVVRLPKGHAIEFALIDGVPAGEIVSALADLNATYSLPLEPGWQSSNGADLAGRVRRVLKSNNGLHAPFVHALPGVLPGLATSALSAAIACARGRRIDAVVQL